MKLGISSYTFPWACGIPGHAPASPLRVDGLCRRARDLGVDVVQVCENIPLTRSDWASLKETGLQIEIGTRGLAGENLARACEAATYFRSPVLRLVIDSEDSEPSPLEAVSRLRSWVDRLRGTGTRLAIENHDRFPARVLAEIVESLGCDEAGVTLDTANSFGALEGPEAVLDILAPYVLSLHVKDFTIRRLPTQLGFVIEGSPAGEGRLNIPEILGALRGAGRDPGVILELWTPQAESLEATIARESAWADRSVAALRKWLEN